MTEEEKVIAKSERMIAYALSHNTDISPEDRKEWAMWCCALKVLGYDEETFVALSSGNEKDSRQRWKDERNPERYVPSRQAAAGKIIYFAKCAGIEQCFDHWQEAAPFLQPTFMDEVYQAAGGAASTKPTFISEDEVDKAAGGVASTNLYQYLCSLFNESDVRRVCDAYRVGATMEFSPIVGTAFPFINANGQCVDMHLMAYNPDGHRNKNGYSQNWMLSKMDQSGQRAKWPLFGEHLLAGSAKPMGIVESEKTALICSLVVPWYDWCAVGGKNNLTELRMSAAKGREIYLFPDLDGIDDWRKKRTAFVCSGYDIYFCGKYIQANATNDKCDIADIIINSITE